MAEYIVRAGRLLDPPGFKLGQAPHIADRLLDIPDLVGIHHELSLPTDFLTENAGTANICLNIAAYLLFKMSPTRGNSFARQKAHLFVGIPQPACRGRIGRIAKLLHLTLAR